MLPLWVGIRFTSIHKRGVIIPVPGLKLSRERHFVRQVLPFPDSVRPVFLRQFRPLPDPVWRMLCRRFYQNGFGGYVFIQVMDIHNIPTFLRKHFGVFYIFQIPKSLIFIPSTHLFYTSLFLFRITGQNLKYHTFINIFCEFHRSTKLSWSLSGNSHFPG